MPSTNATLEALFSEWAELLKLVGADHFRVRAYERAAHAIAGQAVDLSKLELSQLQSLSGIGKGTAGRIREFVETGTIAELEDLREQVPGGMRDLLRVPGLGPKKAILLNKELGVSTLEDLKAAIEGRKLRDIKGLGPKTESNLKRALELVSSVGERVLIDQATATADLVVSILRDTYDLSLITPAGSLRRGAETIGDIDIVVACDDEKMTARIMDTFCEMPPVADVLAHGPTKSSVRMGSGMQVDLRVLPTKSWGAGLVYFTGSKEHNVRIRELAVKMGLRLNEWGLFDAETGDEIASETEDAVYDALGFPWIPPTLREDRGELDAAKEGRLPELLRREDIIADFHSHTDMTDGRASLETMLESAKERGYRTYTITDHAEGLSMTGVGREAMLKQRKQIAKLQEKYPDMRILHGVELNIAKDGSVDYDDEFLATFDICVASVHSHFRMSESEMTARFLKAIENPNVHVIGHPSARLIGRREAVAWDLAAICDAAARTGTALEINCFPDRMDLRDEHVRFAIERGVTLTVDTDAHSPRDLDNLRFGLGTAQRGWATAENVLNTRSTEEILAFVARKRDGV